MTSYPSVIVFLSLRAVGPCPTWQDDVTFAWHFLVTGSESTLSGLSATAATRAALRSARCTG